MIRISIHRSVQHLAATAALALCAASSSAQTAPQPRITAQIDNASRVTLANSRPPRARAADDIGAVPASLQLHGISLAFSRSPAQQAALDALVSAQQNPASPLYHQWITPDQYAAQFGISDADLAAAKAWLEQQGFSIDSVSRSHNRIYFSGTAAQVANAFGAPLHYYLTPATAVEPARTHFAPSADLTLPAALASSVLAVGNLSDFHLIPHILRASQPAQPRFTSSQTGAHFLTPGDLATIYDITPAYSSGFTGSNQSIAVIGQSAIKLSDVTNFQSAVGIPGKTPIVVLVPNSGTSQTYADGNEAESDLDLEYSSTIAKGAQVYFVYTGNSNSYGAFDSIVYAVDERIAPIISSSYGQCEPSLGQAGYTQYNASLEQAAAQGQTILSAAGDAGSTDCYGEYKSTDTADNEQLAVDFPGSSQYVTSVGGTEFPSADVAVGNNTYFDAQSSTDIISSAKSYIPEMVWNDDAAAAAASVCPGVLCSPFSAGGGGSSIFTPQPSWQTGTIAGVAIPNTGHRMVPDVALTASPFNAPLAFCTSDTTFWGSGQKASCNNGLRDSSTGDLTVGGGTSFEAPTVAGLVAIINQAKNSTGQGVINSTLYTIAATSAYSSAFHDITSGGNQCLSGAAYCTSTATADYPATTGYDEASGLGSLDFNNLLTAWPSAGSGSSLLSTTTTLTAATTVPASGVADVITITVAPTVPNATVPTGTVAISVDGGTATSQPLTAGVATYSFSSTTAGAHVVTATYSGDTLFAPSTGSIAFNVGGAPVPTFTLATSAPTPTVAPGASSPGTLTITPTAGFTGTITLSATATGLTYGCVVLGSSSVAITGTTPATASYTIYTSATSCPTAAARPGSGNLARNQSPRRAPWKQLPVPASLAGIFLIVSLRGHRRLRGKLLSTTLALIMVCTLSFSGLALTGCGGSTSTTPTPVNNTPAGTYILTITGTSGNTAVSTNITLTVS